LLAPFVNEKHPRLSWLESNLFIQDLLCSPVDEKPPRLSWLKSNLSSETLLAPFVDEKPPRLACFSFEMQSLQKRILLYPPNRPRRLVSPMMITKFGLGESFVESPVSAQTTFSCSSSPQTNSCLHTNKFDEFVHQNLLFTKVCEKPPRLSWLKSSFFSKTCQ
jgi:hypothetical protein